MTCYLCNGERGSYFGYFCPKCLMIQRLMKLYSPEVVWDLADKALKVQAPALERKTHSSINSVIKGSKDQKFSNPLV